MKKPWYQQVWEVTKSFIAGAVLLIALLSDLSGSLGVSIPVHVYTLLLVLLLIGGIYLYLGQRTGGFIWQARGNQFITIRRFERSFWLGWLGMVIVCTIKPSIEFWNWWASPVIYRNDFSQDVVGRVPEGWTSFGNAPITSTIEYAGGPSSSRKVLVFPELSQRYEDKILIHNNLDVHVPYTATVKLNFQTDTDNAGIVIGWKSYEHYVRVLANVYNDKIEIWQNLPGREPIRYGSLKGEPGAIDPQKNYWLRVVARIEEQKHEFEVQWSDDGIHFISTNASQEISDVDLSGGVGLITTGPNLPKTVFDDFQVEYFPN